MVLPNYVAKCIETLENSGAPCYAVGGCVRDTVLGLEPCDYDLCTAALPTQIQQLFHDHTLVLAGLKHGTVGIVTAGGVVEITTFRTEGDYQDSRHPGWVKFVDNIEEDLARRDFTVNAMAWSPSRGFADPFGGREDLKNRILRAVGDPETRFREDALRILRGVRFAVRFGLTPEENTLSAMERLAPAMENLAKERIFDELCKLLPRMSGEDLLKYQSILCHVLPELTPTVGFQQHSRHHAHDVFTHTAHVLGAASEDLAVRWAALLHDIGKPSTFTVDENGNGHFYGHAGISAEMADKILLRLKAPTALRQRVVLLIKTHMQPLTDDRKLLRRRLSQYGEEAVRQMLVLQSADRGGKGVNDGEEFPASAIRTLLDELVAENTCLKVTDLAVSGHDLMALGLSGSAIGKTLNALLEQVIDEKIPNEKDALLAAVPALPFREARKH